MKEQQIRAADAQALLDNPIFKASIEALNKFLDGQILGMSVDNHAQCARIVQAKQLVKGMEREIARFIENGEIQNYLNLEEEREKRNTLPRTMQR